MSRDPMTAVDHAELKRLAEGATPGPWREINATDDTHSLIYGQQKHRLAEAHSYTDGDGPTRSERKSNAAFIAAANPATVLELLSEIEGLKAERDGYRLRAAELKGKCDSLSSINTALNEEVKRHLRTQAPDSWRPIAEHDNSADEVLVMAEGFRKPIVAWRHHPSSRTDEWLSVPGKYRVKPTEFHPLPALRPQTAESGK